MARASRSIAKRARHKKWIKRAKGFRGRRSKVFKLAKEAVIKAGQYAYRDRRRKKTEFRALWQLQINAASRTAGVSYSQLMHGLRRSGITLNRKILAHLATKETAIFRQIVDHIQKTK
jgi:large subunit ribosomal protein L20